MIHLYMLCKPSADPERSTVSRLWTYSTLHISNLGWQLGPNGLFPAVLPANGLFVALSQGYWGPAHCLCTPKVRIPLLYLKRAIQGSLHLAMTFKRQDVICGKKGFNFEPIESSPEDIKLDRKKHLCFMSPSICLILMSIPKKYFWNLQVH